MNTLQKFAEAVNHPIETISSFFTDTAVRNSFLESIGLGCLVGNETLFMNEAEIENSGLRVPSDEQVATLTCALGLNVYDMEELADYELALVTGGV